jgi:hypothetical protein
MSVYGHDAGCECTLCTYSPRALEMVGPCDHIGTGRVRKYDGGNRPLLCAACYVIVDRWDEHDPATVQQMTEECLALRVHSRELAQRLDQANDALDVAHRELAQAAAKVAGLRAELAAERRETARLNVALRAALRAQSEQEIEIGQLTTEREMLRRWAVQLQAETELAQRHACPDPDAVRCPGVHPTGRRCTRPMVGHDGPCNFAGSEPVRYCPVCAQSHAPWDVCPVRANQPCPHRVGTNPRVPCRLHSGHSGACLP